MDHLLDFFDRYVRGPRTALLFDDGFRSWSYSCDQLRLASEAFARRLAAAGLQPGDRLVIWGGNRPEWVAAFWGCLLRGVAVIPIDPGVSDNLVRQIVAVSHARCVLAGDDVAVPPDLAVERTWRMRDVAWPESAPPDEPRPAVSCDTVAEIVFTSGTTGTPKGVVITHRNILANIIPVERVVSRYGRLLWALRPLRLLTLLPLSHMFGQAVTIFLPRLVDAAVVLSKGHHPDEIIRQMRRYRVTLVVSIPRGLEMMRSRVEQRLPASADASQSPPSIPRRLWRYRQVHHLLGWKFCGFVVAGAHLDRELEEHWRRWGYAVIQGYGLTETAPIVAWNQPFRMQHGTVGRPLEGVEVRIADDGEVLVRGESVSPGYLNAPTATSAAFAGGWFHTGDIGTLDATGHLTIRGRKKDEIVTAEGIHVFPEDVERALEEVAGVKEAAVVGKKNHGEHVHAVLVLLPGTDAEAVVRQANARLESRQRIRDFSVWPQPALPRTEALGKLKRYEIAQWVAGGPAPARTGPAADGLEAILARHSRGHPITGQTTLDELGFGSLDRIELAMAIEERTSSGLSEAAIANCRTIGDLRRLVADAPPDVPADAVLTFPRWATSRWARAVRNASQATWVLPLARLFLRLRSSGLDHLEQLPGPVLFAANHQSHFDTPVILMALPRQWRRRVAVAMGREFFDAHFFPARHGLWERLGNSTLYGLAALFFNAFPLPRSGPGARDTLRYSGELVSGRWSILLFPEGHRSAHGEIGAFQPGVGMIASRLKVPVIPVRLEGVDRVLHPTWRWPRRGTVVVRFGPAMTLEGDDFAALARRVEDAVAALLPAKMEG